MPDEDILYSNERYIQCEFGEFDELNIFLLTIEVS